MHRYGRTILGFVAGAIVASVVGLALMPAGAQTSECPPPPTTTIPSTTTTATTPPSGGVAFDIKTATYTGTQKLDVYWPRGLSNMPVVILVHGGGWSFGSRVMMAEQGKELASFGVLAVSIDYRLAPAFPYPAANNDVDAAVAWVKSKASTLRIDPARVALAGPSAGATLAAYTGYRTAGIKALALASGYYDFTVPCTAENCTLRTSDYLQSADRVQASPLTYVGAGGPQTYVLADQGDPTVPFLNATLLVDRLAAAGVSAQTTWTNYGTHGSAEYWPLMLSWLRAVL